VWPGVGDFLKFYNILEKDDDDDGDDNDNGDCDHVSKNPIVYMIFQLVGADI